MSEALVCPLCQLSFRFVHHLVAHRDKPHTTTCPECGARCIPHRAQSTASLKHHMEVIHGLPYTPPTTAPPPTTSPRVHLDALVDRLQRTFRPLKGTARHAAQIKLLDLFRVVHGVRHGGYVGADYVWPLDAEQYLPPGSRDVDV